MNRFRVLIIVGFFVANIACMLFAMSSFNWDAILTIENHNWILSQSKAPLWDSPESPDYVAFTSTYEDLPQNIPNNANIRLTPDWAHFVLRVLLGVLASSVVAGMCSLGFSKPGKLLTIVQMIAITMTSSVLFCLVSWLLFGGWGPPAPNFYGLVGLIAGCLLGIHVGTIRESS